MGALDRQSAVTDSNGADDDETFDNYDGAGDANLIGDGTDGNAG